MWVVAVALAGCGTRAPAEKGAAKDCFAYTAPPGWAPQPSKTGADVVLAGPGETAVGDKLVGDTFVIRFLPAPGALAEVKTAVLAAMNKVNINQGLAEQHRAHPDLPALSATVPPVAVTDTRVAGREAFRIDITNTLTIEGQPTTNVGMTYFVKFGPEVVSIAVGYLAPREAAVKPLAEAFVASINFDRCK
jgi:hypothetical protein